VLRWNLKKNLSANNRQDAMRTLLARSVAVGGCWRSNALGYPPALPGCAVAFKYHRSSEIVFFLDSCGLAKAII